MNLFSSAEIYISNPDLVVADTDGETVLLSIERSLCSRLITPA